MFSDIEDEWESFCEDEKAQREEDNTGSCYRENRNDSDVISVIPATHKDALNEL